MCRTHTAQEVANILDTMADLFAWKRRKGLSELAAVARMPSRGWRTSAEADVERTENPAPSHPAWPVGAGDGSTA